MDAIAIQEPLYIIVDYVDDTRRGIFMLEESTDNTIWERLRQSASAIGTDARITELTIELSWPNVLDILRDYGTRDQQRAYNFRFKPNAAALSRIQDFAAARRKVQEAQGSFTLTVTEDEVRTRLRELGFIRDLKWFQVRDIRHLLSIQNGANFSVPGAGKTTVAFALHLLTSQQDAHVLVVCPKAAFPAWSDIVKETMNPAGPDTEAFQVLSGAGYAIETVLRGGGKRFVINYDLLIQHPAIIGAYLARQPVHLILDESHRMKAGEASQRGALLLNLAPLPIRRDVLSGTPMPQSPSDLVSQLNFLWPGQGLGLEINRGKPPREVLGSLYVRTTKEELGLPKRYTHFHQIGMSQGQLALYSLVRSESLRQLSNIRSGAIDFAGARKSVMRLLQLSSNPMLALRAITSDIAGINSGLVDQVVEDGPSPKMRAVVAKARELAQHGRKSVIWTIFTDNIEQMLLMLADLNPVALYGAVPSGSPTDPCTREGRLLRFHQDDDCMVMIANPAAAGEGISLHTVCHEALYLDRSYVSTHYLQSIDRIHRLGLDTNEITNVHIFQTRAPQGLGCIDHSVSRRLATKVRAMQQLLDDRDLHQIALDEENAEEPIDYDVDLQDIVDLIEELEGRAQFNENEGG
ncbi:SNF2-related protein [Robbsia andropogonis]|uniref:SNF2-related protein n=1 Tax=Robbsia andropogonis TaxID=28092 RepID=UPI00209E8C61|nr:DEAD/DEAH box helicase [Robbsia andropogonis]MCP1121272.1 DEAD/DEAH box helicase [Robbsia andropogonis]MCP1131065.1 DEAD/DEAH box helicase [Robbsia andropogonis]